MERVLEVSWVLNHLGDLESDFSVFHRVADIYEMPSLRFFRLAERIFFYEGACLGRARTEYAEANPQPQEQPEHQARDVQVIGSDAASIRASPLGQYVSTTEV